MIKLQDNLTTGELSLQGINSSGQRIFEKSLTPYPANALIGTSSSSKMLVGDGAVSQVVSKVGQVQNNRLALENTLIWNKITPVYPDISPTFIPRAFIIESNGKKLLMQKTYSRRLYKKTLLSRWFRYKLCFKKPNIIKRIWGSFRSNY